MLKSFGCRKYGKQWPVSSMWKRWLVADREKRGRNYDLVIVGGGIVGLATARQLILRHPDMKFLVVEKENALAMHQSSHNSGVIHSGIYYTPGTLKAKLCVRGLDLTYKYCQENNIPFKKCGKLVVAVDAEEIPRLETLYERGTQNGAKDLRLLDKHEIKEIEPNCEGIRAIHSPHTGIVDWSQVAKCYAKNFQMAGGEVNLGYEVIKFSSNSNSEFPVVILGKEGIPVYSRYVVTCGGLFSDRLAGLSGCSPEPRIVPFRGEYLHLHQEKNNLIRGNIYPVPDPNLPFLGVHFTPRMDGSVLLGPNAVLAFSREGYKMSDFKFGDFVDAVTFRGLLKLISNHWKFGASEFYHGLNTRAQVKRLQKYVPKLRQEDVFRGLTGVRAQALDKDGSLVEDFILDQGKGEFESCLLHVRNAPSPAATSSLAIAEMIAEEVSIRFSL